MAYFIIIGGLLGSFLHLILKDGIVKEGEIRAWQNWLIAIRYIQQMRLSQALLKHLLQQAKNQISLPSDMHLN